MAEKKSPFSALVQSQLEDGQVTDQSVNQAISQPISRSLKRRGKSSDPNYVRLSVYIRRETVDALETGGELSDTVQQALDEWLSKRKRQ